MNDLYQKYPELKRYNSALLKYTKIDINNNIVECYERSTVDDDFKDITEKIRKEAEIARLKLELHKMRLRASRIGSTDKSCNPEANDD